VHQILIVLHLSQQQLELQLQIVLQMEQAVLLIQRLVPISKEQKQLVLNSPLLMDLVRQLLILQLLQLAHPKFVLRLQIIQLRMLIVRNTIQLV
jgi:hypothetical protein